MCDYKLYSFARNLGIDGKKLVLHEKTRTREEAPSLRGKKKKGDRGGVRLMGSSWIASYLFSSSRLVPFVPSLGSACRGVLGEREDSRGLPRRQHPMNDRRKTQAIWVFPVAYYQSPRQSQIGSVGPVCAPYRSPCPLPRFHISEPFKPHTDTHAYMWGPVFASEIEYGQVDERRSHVPPRKGEGPPEESIPLRCGFLLSLFLSLLTRRLVIRNSCRRASAKDGLRIRGLRTSERSERDRKNSLRSTRVYRTAACFV